MASAKSRYDVLRTRREPFLRRARDAARVTIPSIMPPEGHNPSSNLPQPNQGFGARVTMTLASRVLISLFPPGRDFMELEPTPEALLELGETHAPDDLTMKLALVTKLIRGEVERKGWRQPINTTLQHLIVTGNVMPKMEPDNSLRMFRLDQYVVVRDPSGRLLEIITEESLFPDSLPEKMKAIYDQENADKQTTATDTVGLYTWMKLDASKGQWKVHQELEETKVPGTEGRYAEDLLPYYPIRWNAVAGEDYGRGKVEEHISDIKLIDGLTKSLNDGSAMASRHVTAVRPGAQGGLNMMRKLTKAGNGDTIVADPDDIALLNFANNTGLQVTAAEVEKLRQEVGAAFLVTAMNTRDAERVTATEVRMVAEEVEGVLGGVYSMLSQEMMLPFVKRLIVQMQDQEALPPWKDDIVEPTILTGLAALGKEQDAQAVMSALQMLGGVPEQGQLYAKWPTLLKKGFLGLGIEDAVRTDAEVAEIRKQMAEMEAMQNAVRGAAGPMAKSATERPTE